MISNGKLETESLITGKISLNNIVDKGFKELIENKDVNIKILVSPS